MKKKKKTYGRTASGKPITDEVVEKLADKAESETLIGLGRSPEAVIAPLAEDWPALGRAVFDAHAPLAGRVSEKRQTTSSSS